jgi:tRNA nucleotidyltransferase (CCA-adding enzyme)
MTINLPSSLLEITTFLHKQNLTTILIGGAVRDYYLNSKTNDFDIEIYNCENITQLQNYLSHFGIVDTKGIKFGVLSLKINNFSYDFVIARTEEKIANGHYGFKITLHKNIPYKQAFQRRDFTINAIGYDINKDLFIDPFNGIDDIKNKILKHINPILFIQDPLRVFRAMQFIARFELIMDNTTFKLCQDIIKQNGIKQLSKSQIKKEQKKINSSQKKATIYLEYIHKLGLEEYFTT